MTTIECLVITQAHILAEVLVETVAILAPGGDKATVNCEIGQKYCEKL